MAINEYKLLGEQFHQIKLKKGIISTNLHVHYMLFYMLHYMLHVLFKRVYELS